MQSKIKQITVDVLVDQLLISWQHFPKWLVGYSITKFCLIKKQPDGFFGLTLCISVFKHHKL